MAALQSSLTGAFRFSGRASRSEFWWSWTLLYILATILLLYRGLPITGARADGILTVLLCAVAVPMVAVGTRRHADAGVWRLLFVLTVLLGTAQQAFYWVTMPSIGDFYAMSFQAERDGVTLPLTGYELHHALRALRNDVLPWTARILAILCLLLAMLPSRGAVTLSGPQSPEVTP
ncbi:MAG: DUF805 domain-containing protein [Pseudorhodobacter sp.]